MLQLGDLTTTLGIVGILVAANIRQNALPTPTEKRTVLIPIQVLIVVYDRLRPILKEYFNFI